MQSAPNFIQGAMSNALRIQTDPAGALNTAQKAFAGSGALALKLTALIDAEEKQAQDYELSLADDVMQREQQIETGRHNMAAEANVGRRLDIRDKEYGLNERKYNEGIDLKLAQQTENISTLGEEYKVGTESDNEQVDTAAKTVANQMLQLEVNRKETNAQYDEKIAFETAAAEQQDSLGLTTEARASKKELSLLTQEKADANLKFNKAKDAHKIELAGIEDSRSELGKVRNKPKTFSEYNKQVETRIAEINDDPKLSKIQKIGKISKLNADRAKKEATITSANTATRKTQAELAKEDRKQVNALELETEKSKNTAARKTMEIKLKSKLDGMKATKKAAFEEYLDEKMSGPIDFFIRNPATILRDFEDEYKGN